jgi:hypothetical protein
MHYQSLQQQQLTDCTSCVGGVRGKERWLRKAGSIKRRVALDFSLDETAVARLTLGLGDSHTPGFSLFTMPMVDIREMPHQVRSRPCWCAGVNG